MFSAAAFLFPLFLSLCVSFPPLLSFFLLLAHNQIKCDFVLNFSQRLCTHFGTAFRVARVAGSFAERGGRGFLKDKVGEGVVVEYSSQAM